MSAGPWLTQVSLEVVALLEDKVQSSVTPAHAGGVRDSFGRTIISLHYANEGTLAVSALQSSKVWGCTHVGVQAAGHIG